jgi:predicted small lipoprotein YifL
VIRGVWGARYTVPIAFNQPGVAMRLRVFCLLILFALFAACGQKGDLYLPERAPAPDETEQTEGEGEQHEEEAEGEQ